MTGGAAETVRPPRIVAWEVTRRCILKCKHCRGASADSVYQGELDASECMAFIEKLASWASPMIIFTGGEPLLRPDIWILLEKAAASGFKTALATCGGPVDPGTARRIKESGISRVSVSLDGATAGTHDAFRCVDGAFDAALRGIRNLKAAGVEFQVNTTISRHNRAELPAIAALAADLGATAFDCFLLVPTGRGMDLAAWELSAEEYETTLEWIADLKDSLPLEIRVTCAPHYQRILARRGESRPAGDRGAPKGCLGGKSFVFVSHTGDVQICGFLAKSAGNLRDFGLDLRRIWEESDFLADIRNTDRYGGKCGICGFRRICGGCRARAFAVNGDFLSEEPFCTHNPEAEKPECGGNRASTSGGSAPPAPLPLRGEPDGGEAPLRGGSSQAPGFREKLLSMLESGFPLVPDPLSDVARNIGSSIEEVSAAADELLRTGVIRRIGPVFDARSLGFSSTLVMGSVPRESVERAAQLINAHPEVTHNYLRNHEKNLWFTVIAPSEARIGEIIAGILEALPEGEFASLPALKVFKIDARFAGGSAVASRRNSGIAELSNREKELAAALESGFRLSGKPFEEAGKRAGMSGDEAIALVESWISSGIVRRFGAVLSHVRMGFKANGMCVFDVESCAEEEAGNAASVSAAVTHCYTRTRKPGWRYNLYAMAHGMRREEIEAFANGIRRIPGVKAHEILYSDKELKKSAMRFFGKKSEA